MVCHAHVRTVLRAMPIRIAIGIPGPRRTGRRTCAPMPHATAVGSRWEKLRPGPAPHCRDHELSTPRRSPPLHNTLPDTSRLLRVSQPQRRSAYIHEEYHAARACDRRKPISTESPRAGTREERACARIPSMRLRVTRRRAAQLLAHKSAPHRQAT